MLRFPLADGSLGLIILPPMTRTPKPKKPPGAARQSNGTKLLLDGSRLTLEKLDELLGHPLHVELSDSVWSRMQASCSTVQKLCAGDKAAYGINTGFGHLCNTRIPSDQLERLQTNLIESHAVGVGDPVPPELVRWMILFKLHALSFGVSGISRTTVECLIKLLNADILPVVPSQGSLGASGDLAPLAHMVLPLIGRGYVRVDGVQESAADALKRFGIETVTLGPKEGLAFINGTQMMAAYAAACVVRARRLAKHADVFATLSLESIKGSARPFDARMHALRPHPGALASAGNVRNMMAGSEILESHADCDRVQDPYSLRCVPAVHGASRDSIEHVAGITEREINSVTDNPLLIDGEVFSGGLFHGQPLALGLDYLAIALAELASISERRIYLLLGGMEGLPVSLMKDTGLNSGFMLPQYTAAALVSENKGLCMPSSVDSIPTSLGQEDHVSMGARSAVKCMEVLVNAETVLAIEQLCAAQALDFRAPLLPGVGLRAAHREIRKHIDHTEADHLYGKDIQTSLSLLRSQDVVRAVEREIGALN